MVGLETWRETFELLAAADPAGGGEVQDDEALGRVLGGMPDGDAAKALWAKFEGFVARVTPPVGPQPCRVFVAWLEELIGSDEPDGRDPEDEVGLADYERILYVREGPSLRVCSRSDANATRGFAHQPQLMRRCVGRKA